MKAVSALFHPLLMATYCCVIFYFTMPEIFAPVPQQSIPYFILSVFVLTFVIPVLSILFLRFTRRLSNLELSYREERIVPFFFISSLYAVTTYLFYSQIRLTNSLLTLMVIVSLLVFIIFLVSIWFKISVHSAGIWGTAGVFSAMSLKYINALGIGPLLILFIIAGITTSSRLYLGRHTPMESWSGVVLGFTLCFVGFILFG